MNEVKQKWDGLTSESLHNVKLHLFLMKWQLALDQLIPILTLTILKSIEMYALMDYYIHLTQSSYIHSLNNIMEELLKQSLEYYSNSDFTLQKLRKITLPRYDRDTSFAQLSNWTNSDKFCSSGLPRIASQVTQKPTKKMERQQSYSESNCSPIKQMEINLQPISNNEQSYCSQLVRSKNKRSPRQLEFIADRDQQHRKSISKRVEILSTGKIQQILKKQKEARFGLLHQQYLQTTRLMKHIQHNKPSK